MAHKKEAKTLGKEASQKGAAVGKLDVLGKHNRVKANVRATKKQAFSPDIFVLSLSTLCSSSRPGTDHTSG
jgi:hypothetical protein